MIELRLEKTGKNLPKLIATALCAVVLILAGSQQTSKAATATIGSCYDLVKLGDIAPPAVTRDLYVLIDQTMELPQKLQEETY